MNLKMADDYIYNPITGSRIKKGGGTHKRLSKGNFLNDDGTVKASKTVIATEKERVATAAAERRRLNKLRASGSVDERLDLMLVDIKTVEEAVRVTGKVCAYVKATFPASDIKSLSEGIHALNVSGAGGDYTQTP